MLLKYVDKTFNIIENWMFFVGCIVLFQGILNLFNGAILEGKLYFLSESIIIALVGATSIISLLDTLLKIFNKSK